MARHLHEQSGGNPRDQGPVPELANEPTSPRSGDDFPDAPEPGDRPGPGGDLTEEQLEDFADRLGLTGQPDDERSDTDRGTDRGATDEERSDRGATAETGEAGPGRVRRVLVHRVRWVGRPVGRVLIVLAGAADGTGRWLRTTGERFASSTARR